MSALTRQLQVVGDGDESTLLKVAFATSDRNIVDQHFGSAESFAIYGVDPTQARLLTVSEFGQLAQDGNEDKLATKLDLLEGCVAVYCLACGASAVRQLLARSIQPVKVAEGSTIKDLVGGVQQELREGPSTWLAKAIQRTLGAKSSRFDDMDAEGWAD